MSEKVVSLHGDLCGVRERQEACISVLVDLIERAEAGEVVGVALCALHHDGLASYSLGGRLGGYALVGAAACMQRLLISAQEDD